MPKPSKSFLRQNPHLAERIDYCVKKLKEEFNPQKIILFGSFARGEFSENKTMDIMVIAKTNLKFFDRIKGALEACSGGEPSVEPLVYTPKELNLLLSQGEGFLEDALEEGVVLYEKKRNQ
jgi:predicted nucleotidyltransferase